MQFTEMTISDQAPSKQSSIAALFRRIQQAVPRKLGAWQELALRKLRAQGLLGEYDLVFVIYPGNKGWILDAICREIAAYFPGKYCYHYGEAELPTAKAYFLSHYSLYPTLLRTDPKIANAKVLVFYTHPKALEVSDEELVATLNRSTKVVFTSSRYERLLHTWGVNPDQTTYILGGADPGFFQPHQRANGMVGLFAAFHLRKEPDRLLALVKAMPHRQFMLLGKNWQQYEKFSELIGLPNFSYIETPPYQDYPKYHAQIDVYVSISTIEGGTISLIETMMSNIFPVVSDTGYNPDIITSGENGFIFETDAPIEKICTLIDRAFTMTDVDIRKTVEHLSWKNFSLGVQKLL
jgi:glycosyltransferase involved in cell wall biosynthesis